MRQFNSLTFTSRQGKKVQWLALVLIALLALWMAVPTMAATPPAGSVIGNQATATYTDASGQTKTATSNLVETTVQQVGSFTLTTDNAKTAAIGNTVYMPHTLTNTGNGSDSFVLSLADVAPSAFTSTNIAIYLDANGDGVPDSTTPLASGIAGTFTTPSLPAGGTYGFVVSMSVPVTATDTQQDAIEVKATATNAGIYTTSAITNTDTLTVTTAAAFQVNKSISASQGPTGVVLTYTLTYKNTGAAPGILALYDVIGSGTTVGYSYVPGSAVWSAGNTALTDAYVVGTPDATVGGMEAHYKAAIVGAVTTIQANITNVGPNVTGTITFQVNVLSTATVGTGTTTNTANYGVGADSDPTDNSPTVDSTTPSNPSAYNVLASYNVVLNDGTDVAGVPTDGANTRPGAAANDNTDPDGTGPGVADGTANPDLSYIASASPGQTISFTNTVWNTGNTTDTFNVTATGLGGPAWPAGTTFQLYKSDGATPLMDTNGDGIADTGSLASGASYNVILKVTLPAGACTGGCPTGPFDVEKIATSVADPTKTNKTYDRLGAITPPVVDLANSTIAADPLVNADVIGAAATTTNSVLPGGTTTFHLFIRNEGLVADTYSLAYSGTNAFSPTTALPAGWTLKFMDGTSVINSVGPLAAGAEKEITAVVTVPANALAATTDVYFQVKSQVTGAFDTKWDAVTVTAVNGLTLEPSNSGQVYPGGTVVYAHTLTNAGNTSCATAPNTFTFTVNETLAAQGWTFVLYKDVNGDGLLDAGDTVLPGNVLTYSDANNILDPGEQAKILVKVFAPAGASAGSTDVLSIYATSNCALASSTATDTTTVVTGQVRLTKVQALDLDCSGTLNGAEVYTTDKLTAAPGKCIIYKVTATNEGLGNVTALKIEDSLPAFTSQFPVDIANPSTVNPVCSAGSGLFSGNIFSCGPAITLAPAAIATMTFSVKVQQ